MTNNRVLALELASKYECAYEDIVKRAQAYLDFLEADDLDGAVPDIVVPSSVEPGVRKKRSKKETPIETIPSAEDIPETLEVSDTKEVVVVKEASKPVEYRDVQFAVLNLIKNKGKEPAVEVLKHLNVATALDLEPEQYPKALALFQAALAD
jgi:hypothetical protein